MNAHRLCLLALALQCGCASFFWRPAPALIVPAPGAIERVTVHISNGKPNPDGQFDGRNEPIQFSITDRDRIGKLTAFLSSHNQGWEFHVGTEQSFSCHAVFEGEKGEIFQLGISRGNISGRSIMKGTEDRQFNKRLRDITDADWLELSELLDIECDEDDCFLARERTKPETSPPSK